MKKNVGGRGYRPAESGDIFIVKREHFTKFCPLEGHLKGHFITFSPLEGDPRGSIVFSIGKAPKSELYCVLSTGRAL